MKRPKNMIGVWDNGGETADRYTVAFERDPSPALPWTPYVPMLCMSSAPASPLGVSMWSEGLPGPHLGRKITWGALPAHIRAHVLARLKED